MDPPGVGPLADRAQRGGIEREQVDDRLEAGPELRVDAGAGNAQSPTSGATITQRSGSSPSLNVSSPGRSAR